MIISDWEELDKANQRDGHYNRRPAWVTKAENALENAQDELNRMETAFENRQTGFDQLDYSSAVVNAVSHYVTHCRQCWHEGKDEPSQTLGEFLVEWQIIKPCSLNQRINIEHVRQLERELLPDPGYTPYGQPPPGCYGL